MREEHDDVEPGLLAAVGECLVELEGELLDLPRAVLVVGVGPDGSSFMRTFSIGNHLAPEDGAALLRELPVVDDTLRSAGLAEPDAPPSAAAQLRAERRTRRLIRRLQDGAKRRS